MLLLLLLLLMFVLLLFFFFSLEAVTWLSALVLLPPPTYTSIEWPIGYSERLFQIGVCECVAIAASALKLTYFVDSLPLLFFGSKLCVSSLRWVYYYYFNLVFNLFYSSFTFTVFMIGSSHVRAQFSHYVICLRFKTLDIRMNEDEEWMRRTILLRAMFGERRKRRR